MNWTRYKLLIISGTITLLACVGLVFWLMASAAASEKLEKEIQSSQMKQGQLTSMDLYPSKENYAVLLEEQAKVKERRDAIFSAIQDGQIKVRPISRSLFGDYVQDLVPVMREKAVAAKKGGEVGVLLRDADFGLTAYLEGTLPNQSEINRLVVEIETMKHLADVLFESGISELVKITAKKKEQPEEPRGGLSAFRPSLNSAKPVESNKSEFETERERMFQELTYQVEFRVYEDFFWETMNELLADPNQVAISSLAVTNGNRLLWPDYLKPVGEREAPTRRRRPQPTRTEDPLLGLLAGGTPSPREPVVEEKLPGLAERRQYVVGGDLLNVVMELKVYRLKSQSTERDGGGV